MSFCKYFFLCSTHPGDISRPELNRAEQTEDDDNCVEEVGEDGSPLVAQEINHLALQHSDLGGRGAGVEGGREKRQVMFSANHFTVIIFMTPTMKEIKV